MSYFRPIAKDFAVDPTDEDMLIVNGDFAIEESDQRHVQDILEAGKGEWREFPVLGVEIQRYLNGTGQVFDRTGLLKTIRVQLEYDNFDVKVLDINRAGIISIDAKRIR